MGGNCNERDADGDVGPKAGDGRSRLASRRLPAEQLVSYVSSVTLLGNGWERKVK